MLYIYESASHHTGTKWALCTQREIWKIGASSLQIINILIRQAQWWRVWITSFGKCFPWRNLWTLCRRWLENCTLISMNNILVCWTSIFQQSYHMQKLCPVLPESRIFKCIMPNDNNKMAIRVKSWHIIALHYWLPRLLSLVALLSAPGHLQCIIHGSYLRSLKGSWQAKVAFCCLVVKLCVNV